MIRSIALTISVLLHVGAVLLTYFGLPFFEREQVVADRLVIVEVATIAEVTNAPPPSDVADPKELPVETATASAEPERPAPPPPPAPSAPPAPPVEAPPAPSVAAPPIPTAPPPPPEVAQPEVSRPEPVPAEIVPPDTVAEATPEPVPTPEPEVVEPEVVQPEVVEPEVVEPEVVEPEPAPVEQAELAPLPTLRPTPPPRRQVAEAPEPPKQDEPVDPFASVLKTVETLESRPKPNDQTTEQVASAQQQRQNAPSNADRPLSVSELDAIRQQISGCWLVPAGAKNAEDLIVEVRVRMRPDRTVAGTEVLDPSKMTDPFFRAAAESAIRALRNPNCSPLNLPADKYETWKSFIITFNPRDMLS
jgi:hypothetical protein